MATKKQLAEQVLRKISGGNIKPDSQIDIREVMLDLDQLRDEYVRLSYYENMKDGHYTIDQAFLSHYSGVAVSSETGVGYTFSLPANPVDLPRNVGIHAVYEYTPHDQCVVVDISQAFAYAGKPEINVTGQSCVYFRNEKGIFADQLWDVSKWSLPSYLAAQYIYDNLVDAGIISFTSSNFWTSTEVDANNGYQISMSTGAISSSQKSAIVSVLPVRSFKAPVGAFSIGDLVNGYYIFYVDGGTYYQTYSTPIGTQRWSNVLLALGGTGFAVTDSESNSDAIVAQAGHSQSAAEDALAPGVVTPVPSTLNIDIIASSKDIAEASDYPLTPDAESAILDRLFEKYVPTKQIPHDEIEDGVK